MCTLQLKKLNTWRTKENPWMSSQLSKEKGLDRTNTKTSFYNKE